jgi:hypothetical protein
MVQLKKLGKINLIKKIIKKDPIEMIRFKTTCSKWHFGQVGHGGKKPIRGFFYRNSQ